MVAVVRCGGVELRQVDARSGCAGRASRAWRRDGCRPPRAGSAGIGDGSQATPPPARSIRCRPSTTSTTRRVSQACSSSVRVRAAEVAADIVRPERAAQVREQAVLGRLAALGVDEVAEHELVGVAARAVVRVGREQRRGAAARRTGDDGARPVRIDRDVDGDQLVRGARSCGRRAGRRRRPGRAAPARPGRVPRPAGRAGRRARSGRRARARRWRAARGTRAPGSRTSRTRAFRSASRARPSAEDSS